MSKIVLFNFRINAADRECLARLARAGRRSMSDTLRLLIRDAYAAMLLGDEPTMQKDASNGLQPPERS